MAQLDPNSKKEEELDSPIQLANDTNLHLNQINDSTPTNKTKEIEKKIENVNSEKQQKINSTDVICSQMPSLEYKYAPVNVKNNNIDSNFISQQNIFNNYNQHNYNVYDYNDQSNYDLYYQSLYQMYPQMSDVS